MSLERVVQLNDWDSLRTVSLNLLVNVPVKPRRELKTIKPKDRRRPKSDRQTSWQ